MLQFFTLLLLLPVSSADFFGFFRETRSYDRNTRAYQRNTRAARPAYVDWTADGGCIAYAADKSAMGKRDLDVCRQAKPSHFEWTTNGYCYEKTPANVVITKASSDECERVKPTHFAAIKEGGCGKFTEDQTLLQKVDDANCDSRRYVRETVREYRRSTRYYRATRNDDSDGAR